MLDRNVAFRHGYQTGYTRFAGQQIIVAGELNRARQRHSQCRTCAAPGHTRNACSCQFARFSAEAAKCSRLATARAALARAA